MLRWYETRLATDPFSNRAAVSQDLDTVAIWTHFSFPTWALYLDKLLPWGTSWSGEMLMYSSAALPSSRNTCFASQRPSRHYRKLYGSIDLCVCWCWCWCWCWCGVVGVCCVVAMCVCVVCVLV